MNQCCDQWLLSGVRPRTLKIGIHKENRICPKCGTEFRVTFRGEAILGQRKPEISVVGADPVIGGVSGR